MMPCNTCDLGDAYDACNPYMRYMGCIQHTCDACDVCDAYMWYMRFVPLGHRYKYLSPKRPPFLKYERNAQNSVRIFGSWLHGRIDVRAGTFFTRWPHNHPTIASKKIFSAVLIRIRYRRYWQFPCVFASAPSCGSNIRFRAFSHPKINERHINHVEATRFHGNRSAPTNAKSISVESIRWWKFMENTNKNKKMPPTHPRLRHG